MIRMFETVMLPYATCNLKYIELYPPSLRKQTSDADTWVYIDINNGAHKAGESRCLSTLEKSSMLLCKKKSVTSSVKRSQSDIRAFTTLWCHDPIYHNRMKLKEAYLFETTMPCGNGWAASSKLKALKVGHKGMLAHASKAILGARATVAYPLAQEATHGYPHCYGRHVSILPLARLTKRKP